MKKISRVLFIIAFLLSILNSTLSANNKNNGMQKSLQKQNEAIVNRVLALERAYQHITNDAAKVNISDKIFAEVKIWSANNKQLIFNSKGGEELSVEEKKALIKTTNKELLSEIKNGQIPEIMLKTVSPKFAIQIKQRAEIQTSKKKR